MGAKHSALDWHSELQELCDAYENADDKERPRELARSDVIMGMKLGKGYFGTVSKCTVKGDEEQELVVKSFKGVPKEVYEDIFLGVAQLAQLRHADHVIKLYGVVTATTQLHPSALLVVDFCECGSLDVFVAHRIGMGTADKLDILSQVADGMSELEANKFVHRSLSAKNILVTDGGETFKIGDWGRKGDDPQYQAPEVMKKEAYSHHSDVWAFGMVCTVVFDDGNAPFPEGWTNEQVTDRVMGGYTPKQKEHCPDFVFDVVQKCWSEVPSDRPGFYWLRVEFEDKERIAREKLNSR